MWQRREVLLACAVIGVLAVIAVVLSHLFPVPAFPAPLESDAGH